MNLPTYPGFKSTPLDFGGLPPLHLTEDPIFVSLFVDPVAEKSLIYTRNFMSRTFQTDTRCSVGYYFDSTEGKLFLKTPSIYKQIFVYKFLVHVCFLTACSVY
jgi:hypothetical protein